MKSRLMQCPFCGHKRRTTSIGAVSCGPHKLADTSYAPAYRMMPIKIDKQEMKINV